MQLALSFTIHPLIFCIHLLDKEFLSFLPEQLIFVVHLLDNCYCHVTYTMTSLVKVVSSGLCQIFVIDISAVFRKSLLQ